MKDHKNMNINDMDLESKKEELELLERKEEKVQNDIKELAEEFSSQLPDIIQITEHMNKLPFESLKEMYDFQGGLRKPYKKIVDIKSKLIEKKEKELDKLDSINADIRLSKIDILLAEIKSLDKNL